MNIDTLFSVEVLISPSRTIWRELGILCLMTETSSSVTGFSVALGVMNQQLELRYPSFQTASVLLKILMHSIKN